MATYDDWTPELQRFSQLGQRTTDYNTAGMLAIAAELAALRKSQEPQMLTAVLATTSHSEQSLWDGADRDELPPGSKLQHVGWYCAGGHVAPHNAPDLVPPSLKFEDPCDHAVPMYVLVKS